MMRFVDVIKYPFLFCNSAVRKFYWLRVWAGVFVFCVVVGAVVQLWVLPHLFPQFHAGAGLVKGGDWVSFHLLANKLATHMEEQGWRAWRLWVKGNAPIGMAAAVYYLTGIHKPIVMLPIQSMLFALAATLLFRIFELITGSSKAWVGILPLILFPSSFQVYGQLHKDPWSMLGISLLGWVLLSVCREKRLRIGHLVLCFLGVLVIGIVRLYLIRVILCSFWVAFFVYYFMVWLAKKSENPKIISLLFSILFLVLGQGGAYYTVKLGRQLDHFYFSNKSSVSAKDVIERARQSIKKDLSTCQIEYIAKTRKNWIMTYKRCGSQIDVGIKITSLKDLICYLPRATIIGLLAPFPDQWFAGKERISRVMRMLAGIEMMVAYFCFLGLILVFFTKKFSSMNILGMGVFFLIIIVTYVIAVPNVGALYRFRLLPWHYFVGLGAIGWVELVRGTRTVTS